MEGRIYKLIPYLKTIFNHLHENPEISWEEVQTTSYIKSLFSNKDCKIKTFDNSTGLVIDIGAGKPVIAVRADIDALWQEVDNSFRANHSCGHDAHMTIVIGTLFTMLESKQPNKGTFRFIFQPAEEKGTGALAFVEKGIVDDVDYLYGMHLRPIEELENGQFAPAIQHGAAKFIEGTIIGEDAHGARPHLNVNAIQVGAEFIQSLNNIQINPMFPHSVKMTTFHAGDKSPNIIPGNATFSIDVRAQTNEAMQYLTEKVEQIAMMLATFHQIKIELKTSANVAAAVLDEDAIRFMSDAIKMSAGEAKLAPVIRTNGGDDFHFYTIKRPKLKATMLAIGCDLTPGLHHPKMTFNHDVIPKAIEIISNVMINTANSYE
ncbi:M20 peptidase aminoacylase family protein [Oceanobacillus chungangensis]|uniref:Amidohydrolase n=1 Tax=Oceanobacillus chungangensis TaxID=1229152 RepID=A0A3D8PUK0_9BACI|nr:M20 peptidase aminoacylase family protein [Oceanobacillus chungangensis]RDW19793.1 amidohydrolase [Oceanobacillus chungangensis]